MGDPFCSFLDFRPLYTNYNLHVFLSSKHLSSALVHSHHSRINRIKRRPLHLTLLSNPYSPVPSSPYFDVISTHEHSDGSIVFRFGNPSEVTKNVQMEELKFENKETEGEGEEEDSMVKVLDGDHEREVMVKKAERGVMGSDSTEVTEDSSSIVTRSKSCSIVERENELSEKLLESSNDIELPLIVSNVEMKVSSTSGIDIENIENAEEGLNKEREDSCPAGASMFDKSLNIENSIATMESPENKIVDITSVQSISVNQDTVIAVSGNGVFQVSLETVVTTEASTDENVKDGTENGLNELLSLSPQLKPALSLSEDAEEQILQAGMQNVISGSGSDTDSDNNDIVAMSPQMEASVYLTIDAEGQTSVDGTGMPNEIAEDGSESDTIQLIPLSPQLEAGPAIDEESGSGIVEEYMDGDKAESLLMLDNMPQNLTLEPEKTEDNDNVENNDTVEAGNEVTELESTDSATNSQEILMTDFVLSSGAALLPHPSKVLTGGEDAYFVTGKKWIGVADGVGQWSLEGTNPGVYAQELIKNCEKLVSDCSGNSINHPMELLNLSVAETHSPGSSTVLIAQFDGQALQVSNVGDSGFIILRHGTVHKRSSPMLHVFHFPLQIERGDDPSNLAEFYRIDLEDEDVIVIATDGLLDNLFDQEIASVILKSIAADKKLEEIAEMLATKAQDVGRSASARSPFADNAQAAGYAGYTGGKLDDVTVIVSMVQRQSNSETL